MSQEEKAKAYDEMTRLLSNWYKSETDIGIKDHISAIYPEIAESEDERIRQDIITTLSIGVSCDKSALHPGAHTTLKEAITWLKKQEEKPLKFVGKGDIVAFYEEWEGKKRRGIMLVKNYDYGNGDMDYDYRCSGSSVRGVMNK